MEICVLLFALCGFRMIRYGRGLRINGPEGKNITAGKTVPIECHSDQYGIVFEFKNRSSTKSVPIAECEFGTNYSYFMSGGFEAAFTITQISRTCTLTILSLMEDHCGTYSCTELYVKSEYLYCNISCNGTAYVTCTPGVTKVQSETSSTATFIGSILVAVALIALIGVSSACLVCRKRMNTANIPETGALTDELETFIRQETGHEEIDNEPVISHNIDDECTDKKMIDASNAEQLNPSLAVATDFHIHASFEEHIDNESINSSTEALGDDSMERLEEANDYSKPLKSDTNLDKPETYMNNSICLHNLSEGPNVSPVTNDSFTSIGNVPESSMNKESTDSAIEEQIINESSNSNLHNKDIVDKIQGRHMDQSLKEELINVAKSGTFIKGMDTFERKKLGEKLLDGQKLKISTFVLNTIENKCCED